MLFRLYTIMFEPIRGGTRGGQAEFKWSDVSADKDREVCVFPPVPLIGSSSPALYRITWAIALTPRQAGGRKIRTFIGTIAIYKEHQTSVRRKFVESRKQRRRHSPLHCMTYFFCSCLVIYCHLFSGFGPSKKETSSSTQGTGTNAIPIPPSAQPNPP